MGARISSHWTHRGFRLGCRALAPFTPAKIIDVHLNDDASFRFPFGDGYWSTILDPFYVYEKDIDVFFRAVTDVDYVLLDCGANYGYWSVLVSSEAYGRHKAVAVEPSSVNFTWLRENALANGVRFEILQRAIGGNSGSAMLSGRKHESLTIAGQASDKGETVSVSSLDDLAAELGLFGRRCVIKLDVEGVEMAAMDGGQRLLGGDNLLICEDHGNDPTHAVSRYILAHTAMKLFCYDPGKRCYIQLDDVLPLDRIKKASNRGYNVIATASAFWESRIPK